MLDSRSASRLPTLILRDRARLAINVLTRFANVDDPSITFGLGHFNRNPPTMTNPQPWYGKFMESLALMRRIVKDGGNEEVDVLRRDTFLKHLAERKPTLLGPEGGRQLVWLAIKFAETGDETYLREGELSIQRTLDQAVHTDDFCYFPWENMGGSFGDVVPTGWPATWHGWSLQGFVQFHRLTGSEQALTLARKTARYVKEHAGIFAQDAAFLTRTPTPPFMLHFHHNANALLGLTEYAYATGEREYGEFALTGYRYARALGWPIVGFFPEYIGTTPPGQPFVTCEGCCVADMVQMALWLSKAGVADCWDDVDRYVRNQFAHMQMMSTDWLDRMRTELPQMDVPDGHVDDSTAARAVGCFSSWATPNDYWAGVGPGLTNCCTGNCTRALHHVWDNLIEETADGRVRLHLLLDRRSELADVRSAVPEHGRVDVRMKKACTSLEVRAPEWVGSATPRVFFTVNGTRMEPQWRGRYCATEELAAGDFVSLHFPIEKRTVRESIAGAEYTLDIRGNSVVGIEPDGRHIPFYARPHDG